MDAKTEKSQSNYWKTNLIVIAVLLAIWAFVSCFCGIIFIESLNKYSMGNLPLGFWMANQGSMLTFVILILIYALIMDVVDRKYQANQLRSKSLDD